MRLFRHVADALLKGGEIVVDAVAVVKDLPLGGFDQAGEHLHGGAFAGAVGAQVAEDLAWLYREAHLPHGGGVIVVLG